MSANARRLARTGRGPLAVANRAPVQQQPSAPGPGNLPTDFTGHSQHLLAGNMLKPNPYLQSAVLDPARREAERTLAQQQAALEAQAELGGGAFGGDIHQALQTRLGAAMQQNLADQQNAMLYQNYGDERANMMQALAGMGAYETAEADRAAATARANAQLRAQIQAAEIAAQNALDLQGNQLDFSRQGLALDAMNSMARNQLQEAQFMAGLANQGFGQELAMMQLMGELGLGTGQQQLAALGMAPGLEQAGYTGYGSAFGAQQQVDDASAQAAAARARIEAQNAQNAWQHERYNEQQSFDNYLRNLLALNQVGSGSYQRGEAAPNTIPQAAPDPWAAGLGNALATFGSMGGFNLFGGGGSTLRGAGVTMPAPPRISMFPGGVPRLTPTEPGFTVTRG